MRRQALLCSVIACLAVTVPEVAGAAPSAKQLEKAGQKAEKQKNWEEAKSAYEKAIALDDKPATRLRLATAEAELGNLVEATEQIRLALESKKLSPPQQAKAKKQLASLEKRIPTLTFDLPKGFDGKLTLDDKELGASELGGPVPVNPGKHDIRAEADGMKPFHESIDLAEKDKKNLSVLLEPSAAEPADSAPTEEAPAKASGGSNTLAYVALGVGVVGVGVGAFFGLSAKSTKDDIDSKCKNGVCPEDQRDLYDKGKTQATVSTVGFIVGAVGLGAGTVLLLTGGKGKVESKASARRLTPWVGPGQVGMYGQF
jgi:hypothetical protein